MRKKAGPPTPCTHFYTNCCAPQARKKPAEAKRPAGVMKSDYAEAASNATRQGERRRPASATSARETDARRRRWRGVNRQTVTGANTGGDRRSRRSPPSLPCFLPIAWIRSRGSDRVDPHALISARTFAQKKSPQVRGSATVGADATLKRYLRDNHIISPSRVDVKKSDQEKSSGSKSKIGI